MLVLSRRPQEEIVLTLPDGHQIVVTAVSVRKDRMRIGIAAPASVRVDRREVHDRRQEEAA